MYSFEMTSEQRMLVNTVHRYAEDQLRSVYREAEEEKRVPQDAVQIGWEIGLLPGSIEADFGGFGEYSALTNALYLEELAWGDVGISLHLLTPNLVATPIALFGSQEQKETYLPHFCDERFPRATAAVIEPVYQFDLAELATSAMKEGNEYVIDGVKTLVPLADGAEFFLVYAGEKGVTQAFIVDGAAPGIEIGKRVTMMGAQSLAVYEVRFKPCAHSKEESLGRSQGDSYQSPVDGQSHQPCRHGRGPSARGLRVRACLRQGARGLW